jgi:fibrillarin-like rRNA methylase
MRKSGIRLYWNNKRGYLIKLVNFYRLLKANEYAHSNFKELIEYFEERYNISVGDQIKPSKFNGTIEQIKVDFHFLDF